MIRRKPCEGCGNFFMPRDRNERFCTPGCRIENSLEKYTDNKIPNDTEFTTSTKGAISELMVCTDLLRRGYSVFRAVSPSCSCDLIALKDGHPQMIEVKTPTPGTNLGKSAAWWYSSGKFDIIAMVVWDRRIVYFDPSGNQVKM